MLFIFIILLTLFFILNFADAKTTYFAVNYYGYRGEKNPIARFLIKKAGNFKGIVLIKSMILLILPLIIWTYLESPLSICIVLFFLNIVYIWVVFHNLKICKKIDNKYKIF